MGLFGRTRATKKQQSEAVIDIGSHSIKALVFERAAGAQTDPSAPPKVLKKMADRLPLGAERLRIAAKLHELMFLLVREMGGAPGKVTIAIGPHLADYSLASWPVAKAWQEATVSKSRLTRMFEGIAESRQEPERTLWAYPAAVFANGYALGSSAKGSVLPIHFLPARAKQADRRAGRPASGQNGSLSFLALCASLPRRVAEALEEARFAWGGMPIEFIPLPLPYAYALADDGEPPDYLLIDVGDEETMLMRVGGGIVRSVRFFSVGNSEFIRAAAKDGNISFQEAEDRARGRRRGTARIARQTRDAGAKNRAISAWNDLLIRTLDEDYHLGPLGGRVILSGGGAELPEIETAVRSGQWLQKFSHASAPSIRILDGNSFFQGASLDGSVQGPADAGLAVLIRYALRHNDYFHD